MCQSIVIRREHYARNPRSITQPTILRSKYGTAADAGAATTHDAGQIRVLIGDEILLELDDPEQHVADLVRCNRSGDMTLEIEINGKI